MSCKIIFAGGDDRTLYLERMFRESGCETALCCRGEETEIPAGDALVLPLPAVRGGMLFSPESLKPVPVQLPVELSRAKHVFSGGGLALLAETAVKTGAQVTDYSVDASLTVRNAVPTAEGAAFEYARMTKKTICGSSLLITGFGRVGKALALLLRDMGAAVTVAARKPEDRALAEALGLGAVCFPEIPRVCEGMDGIFNTVPETVLDAEVLSAVKEDCALVELASAPYGFDINAALELGHKVNVASGLPGRYAPETAAGAIYRTLVPLMQREGLI